MNYTSAPPRARPHRDNQSQRNVRSFWRTVVPPTAGHITSIFPAPLYANLLRQPRRSLRGEPFGVAQNVEESYQAAATACRERVENVVAECERTNKKFTDPDFDIEADYELGYGNCTNSLFPMDTWWGIVFGSGYESDSSSSSDSYFGPYENGSRARKSHKSKKNRQQPKNENDKRPEQKNARQKKRALGHSTTAHAVQPSPAAAGWSAMARKGNGSVTKPTVEFVHGSIHRVDWIFKEPQFTIDGYSASDIKQGDLGNCWWLAALASITSRTELMERVCVARDERCGVYGFVFQRDGEWVSTVVDDNLYLSKPDYCAPGRGYDRLAAKQHRAVHQTGSPALVYGRCARDNEIWLPLMEKAYAKAHGDYDALDGGWLGQGVEDLTGGVTSTVVTSAVMDRDRLWRELSNGTDFVFGLATMSTAGKYTTVDAGLALGHAYSVLRTAEEVSEDGTTGVRLVQVRNPWGKRDYTGSGEWNGPWSDGSPEWTPYWMNKLNYRFGNDGIFWMAFDDVLATFKYLYRTRLFDARWTVAQRWTSVNIPWVAGYLQSRFFIEVTEPGTAVIVLSQLDTRYFVRLEGQYRFLLHFLLRRANADQDDILCRVRPSHLWESRSVSCEVHLDAGRYEVCPMVMAEQNQNLPLVEEAIQLAAQINPHKLRQIGRQYDVAHAKAGVPDMDFEIERERHLKLANADHSSEDVQVGDEKTNGQVEEDTSEEGDTEDMGGTANVSAPNYKSSQIGKPSDYISSDDEVISDSRVPQNTKEVGSKWDAVCVIGLRVYSMDPEVSVSMERINSDAPSSSRDCL